MADLFCDRCGDYLPEGCIKHTVHIQIISDCDDVFPGDGDDSTEDIQHFLREIKDKDERELEEEVYQEISFILCGKCKKRFAQDPFNRGLRLFRANRSFERLFH